MFRLLIEFTSNRDKCGRLALFDESGARICGPFAVAGRASSQLAAANGNPGRDPRLRYGDTPVGGYAVRRFERSGPGTQFPTPQFGTNGVIVMEGILGEAACAEANGRFHTLICGGKLSTKGLLRSTAGGLRLRNKDLRTLCIALKKERNVHCEIAERETLPNKGAVFDDPVCELQDPPAVSLRESRPRHLSRDLLRGGAAGAMMFSFTVSFVALQGATTAQAAQPASQSVTATRRDTSKMPPPAALPARPYVRMAYNTAGTAPASNAMQQLQNATSGQSTGKTFDNSVNQQPSDATPSGGVSVPEAQPAQTSEPPVTPQQQQMLDNDQQYRQYEQQLSNAQKSSSDAAAHQQQIQNQMNTTTDSAARAQLQVDLAKARQDQSNADSAAAAAKINAQERKKVIIQGAPIKQD